MRKESVRSGVRKVRFMRGLDDNSVSCGGLNATFWWMFSPKLRSRSVGRRHRQWLRRQPRLRDVYPLEPQRTVRLFLHHLDNLLSFRFTFHPHWLLLPTVSSFRQKVSRISPIVLNTIPPLSPKKSVLYVAEWIPGRRDDPTDKQNHLT